MDWKDEEVEQAWTGARGMDVGSREATRAIMSTAVELAAARGGTMTADALADRMSEVPSQAWVDEVMNHISALGARNAVLDAEVKRLAAENERFTSLIVETGKERDAARERLELRTQELKAERDDAHKGAMTACAQRDALAERLAAAEESVRELTRRAQQAETEADRDRKGVEAWRRRLEAAADELADIGAGECGRLDIVTRVKMLKARCDTLSVAGQVLSAHVDTTGAPEEEVSGLCERSYGPSEICGNCDPRDMPEREPHAFKPGHGTRDACRYASVVNGQLCGWERSAHRHPCSPTCTHDDAATPGHAERVRLMSGAVSKVTGLEGTITERGPAEAPVCSRCGRRFPGAQAPHGGEPCDVPLAHPERVKERSEAFKKTAREPDSSLSVTEAACYEQGAEAMRAACWEAVEGQLQACGVYTESPMWNVIKAAIEGAAP